MPIEIRTAYEKGTRSWDGSVSKSYYQNRAKYDIKASVSPKTRQLSGSAKITYFHNFPEPLISVGFHAYKNLYDEGMIIKKLKVDGESLDTEDRSRVRYSETHYGVYIGNNPLTQGDSLEIEIDWSITIPEEVDRDGAFDESSMLVAYWYPEMAVYDDVFGWDMIDFDGKAEFYHDASDFKVEIQIPENFIIWASDAPTNASEVYPQKILDRLKVAEESGENTAIVTKKDIRKGLKMNSTTWKYEVDNFPDFTFAFSDHYLWEASSYEDQFGSYFLNSAYPPRNATFSDVLAIEKEALQSFHNEFPIYEFPFHHFVAFNGEYGGGMEFPGMCNDQAREDYSTEGIAYSNYEANKLLTFHEMMHMYFPFLMGINEKRYAWMDEGMAEFSEDYFTDINLESYRDRSRFATSKNPPLMVETYTIPKSYGINSYDIASQSYHALLHLLGKDVFDKCMKVYMDRWKYKHPTPYDFFFTFNNVSGMDLTWFWKAWYFDWGYPDVGIKSFENGTLTIENIGGRPIAIEIKILFEDDSFDIKKVSPLVWKSATETDSQIESDKKIKSIELKTLNGADAINENNMWIAQ
ncbi:MAG: M1 family metallopeptidase [Cyclobacteriaceae bacterium]